MEQEIWKDVVGYEGAYKVSNYGNIISMIRFFKKQLKHQLNIDTGYLHVGLKGKTKSVHIIVAESFLGFKQCNGKLCINHIDGNKTNNNVDNLEIVTQRYNVSVGLRTKNKTSEYVGVCYHNKHKKWRADIKLGKESRTIGYFENEVEAKAAYESALNHIIKFNKIPNNKIKTKSIYRGVSIQRGKWLSYFDETPNKRIFLGYVKTEKEALDNLINTHLKYI